jgi:hypothetical protein
MDIVVMIIVITMPIMITGHRQSFGRDNERAPAIRPAVTTLDTGDPLL